MERRVKLNAAGVIFDPADKSLECLHAGEFDPHYFIEVDAGDEFY